jgi:hypothetical protein
MDAADVIAVLDALDEAAVRHWVGGGWGVAALAGRQTRSHRDLDLDGGFFEYPRGVFVSGVIAGRVVGCLSAAQQRVFHMGYEQRPQDVHDLAELDELGAANGRPGNSSS